MTNFIETRANQLAQKVTFLWEASQEETNVNNREEIFKTAIELCNAEREFLINERHISPKTVEKNYQQKYRRAIAKACNIEIVDGHKWHQYPTGFFKSDDILRTNLNDQDKVRVAKIKQQQVRITNELREELFDYANDLIEQKNFIGSGETLFLLKQALAITLLTGRRFFEETIRQGTFEILPTYRDYHRELIFMGQAKGSQAKREKIYEIPCFADDIERLVELQQAIQRRILAKPWYRSDMTSSEFQSKLAKSADKALKETFRPIFEKHGIQGISSHDLRKTYAAIAYYEYCELRKERYDEISYLGSILGHDVVTEFGEYINENSSNHYQDFVDARWDRIFAT